MIRTLALAHHARCSSHQLGCAVRQPLAEMGRMAVSLLLRLLENHRVEGLNVELQTRLVVRDSTAPPRE